MSEYAQSQRMENTEDLDDIELYIPHTEEESGSAYEEPLSNADPSSSQDELPGVSRASSTTTRRERGRGQSKKANGRSDDHGDSPHGQSPHPLSEEGTLHETLQTTATVKEAQWPAGIKLPTRPSASSLSKRKAERPSSATRTKRLKGVYNNDYRELLNTAIHEAACGDILDEYPPLLGSQIGSSVWTPEEKDSFFKSLSRLGRHNSRGIALRIGSKSELEVQEYLQLLRQGMIDRWDLRQQPFDLTDFQAAFEISEECDNMLEKAGDGLAARQEHVEEEKERAKWGDIWLLTKDVCASIEQQRREQGERSIEESLPAANLFDLKTWLELPQTIFMNNGEPREDGNWEAFAEQDEAPAIRATAFEDFHALAVSITRRLISTVLFCTMSRRRAMHSIAIKRAEVTEDDVEAAVRILGLKNNSFEFWVEIARRNSLNVFDFDEHSGHDIDLTYDEVEAALRQTRRRSRSRSRSISRQPSFIKSAHSSVGAEMDQDVPTDSIAESLETDDESQYDPESDLLSDSSLDDGEIAGLSDGQVSSRSLQLKESRERKYKMKRAQDAYIETYDNAANQAEENQLWKLVGPSSPVEIKPEPSEMPDKPKMNMKVPTEVDWKDKTKYWSPWETLQSPVPEENFTKNRMRMAQKTRRRIREGIPERDISSEEREASTEESNDPTTRSLNNQEGVKTQDEPADVQMADEGSAGLYSVSESERESFPSPWHMSDDVISQHSELAHRAQLSDEEIAARGNYDD